MNDLMQDFPVTGDCIKKIDDCIRRMEIVTSDELKETAYRKFLQSRGIRLKPGNIDSSLMDPATHDYKASPCNIISYSLHRCIERCATTGIFEVLFYLRDMDIISERNLIL